jgi:hypothetical protein
LRYVCVKLFAETHGTLERRGQRLYLKDIALAKERGGPFLLGTSATFKALC